MHFVFSMSLVIAVLQYTECVSISSYKILQNMQYLGGIITSYQVDIQEDCILLCNINKNCTAINVGVVNRSTTCKLIDHASAFVGTLTDAAGWTFICEPYVCDNMTSDAHTTEAGTTETPTSGTPTSDVHTPDAGTTETPPTATPTSDVHTPDAGTTETPTTGTPTSDVHTTDAGTTETPTTATPTSDAHTTDTGTTETPDIANATSCANLSERGVTENGVYAIDPDGMGEFEVYCDLNPQRTDGLPPGWIVFQRRIDDSVDFYRNWTEYQNGFGALYGNLWLGLDKLARLTSDNSARLHVQLESFANESAYAHYEHFSIEPAARNYMLHVSHYTGTAGDALEFHHGMEFSTFDNDNDNNVGHCAVGFHGAWWYNDCYDANLNGPYYVPLRSYYSASIDWLTFQIILKSALMKLWLP